MLVIAAVFPEAFALSNRRERNNNVSLLVDFPRDWKAIEKADQQDQEDCVASLMQDERASSFVSIKGWNLPPRLEIFKRRLADCDL